MATKAMGASIKRKEDPRLMTGEAKYLDDVRLPGMLYAAILRSPYAHARITDIKTDKAARHPGVVAVFTGQDFKDLPALPCAWQAEAGRIQNNVNTPRVLEIERVAAELERDVAALKERGAADDILQATCAKLLARAKESLARKDTSAEFAARHLEMTRNSLVTAYRQVRARLTRLERP